MLRDSVVAVSVRVRVVRTRPRAIPLAMITMKNQLMGFLFFPLKIWGSAWRLLGPAKAPQFIRTYKPPSRSLHSNPASKRLKKTQEHR